MKMMKRFTNVAVTACVLGLILTGCGAGNGSGDTAATNDTQAAVAESTTDSLHASIQVETDSPDWVKNLPEAKDSNTKQLFYT